MSLTSINDPTLILTSLPACRQQIEHPKPQPDDLLTQAVKSVRSTQCGDDSAHAEDPCMRKGCEHLVWVRQSPWEERLPVRYGKMAE